MDQKRLKVFRERLLNKKQEILEAYNKNKTYGKEADGEATQDIADKAANSYTKEFLFSLSNTERDLLRHVDDAIARLEGRGFGVCAACAEDMNHEAPRGGAVGAPVPLLPGEAGVRAALTRETPLGSLRRHRHRPTPRRPRARGGVPVGLPGLRPAAHAPRAGPAVRAVLGEPAPPPRPRLPLRPADRSRALRLRPLPAGASAVRLRREPRPLRGHAADRAPRAQVRGAAAGGGPAGRGAARGARGARPGGDERRAGAGAAAPAAPPGARLQPVRPARRRAGAAGGDDPRARTRWCDARTRCRRPGSPRPRGGATSGRPSRCAAGPPSRDGR